MGKISLNQVTKSFGDVQVIPPLDLDINEGEFVVFVGPSGCGKSTLLRMIAGLEDITAGEITIGDRVVNNLEPKDRNIAMVFQNYALYPHMDVAKNIGFGLRAQKLPKAEIAAKVQQSSRFGQLSTETGGLSASEDDDAQEAELRPAEDRPHPALEQSRDHRLHPR